MSLNDTITGSSGNDTLEGNGGTDSLNGGDGDDVYQFSSQFGSDVVGNEIINDSGFSGTDVIEIIGSGANIDFSSASVLNIEAVLFTDSVQTVTLGDVQVPSNLEVIGASGSTQTVILKVFQSSFSAADWTFTTWDTSSDVLLFTGNSSANQITGTSQNDIIRGGLGIDTVDGGQGGRRLSIWLERRTHRRHDQ